MNPAHPIHAMPVLIAILCVLAIAYRYYSAFLAAKVAVLDDTRATPAYRFNDGQNYHPTSKWVLFGHHFAAISGAGPLIGPVLAAQFGYLPGLLWIVIGVCLAGAVQDFLVLAISVRRNGKSLAQITRDEVGKTAGIAAMTAILFIIVIALAGLGKVVVKALGGEQIKYPAGSVLAIDRPMSAPTTNSDGSYSYSVPAGTSLHWPGEGSDAFLSEPFELQTHSAMKPTNSSAGSATNLWPLPADAVRIIPGSSWGTFTIACTIPIALLTGLYMYRLRKDRVVEASLLGAGLTLCATFAGGWIAESTFAHYFNLSANEVILAMGIYGFLASVLPVWLLLVPRDYLSSFLKIGTIIALVIGTIIANPQFRAPAYNGIFANGGPVVGSGAPSMPGRIFPFLFITIMCGAISGFHSLVSSGTTPKMIRKESDCRTIGYGAMLIEALVGVMAMIAASTLAPGDYYAMNTDMARMPAFHDRLVSIGADIDHLDVYDSYTREALRGRTGGAVTLAVGMAHIFQDATARFVTFGDSTVRALWRYWYHFAIMFEALFILTTIDTGTRIGRFLLQEIFGAIHPKLGRPDWWPGTLASSFLIVAAWSYFINANSFSAIWAMFGVANQMLAVIALAVVTVVLANEGKLSYLWVTIAPMLVIATTTTTAGLELLFGHYATLATQMAKPSPDQKIMLAAAISGSLIVAMLACTYTILAAGAARLWPLLQPSDQRAIAIVDAS
ncbi:MAG: carbon starvation protein A [Planctomycetota bacterium]|nr:carbon starvation protein A [Planctomycetota bacterium]